MWTRNLILLVAVTGVLVIANAPSASASGKHGGGYGGGNSGRGGGHGGHGGCPPGHWRNGKCGGSVVIVPAPVHVAQPVVYRANNYGKNGGHHGGGHFKGYGGGRRLQSGGNCYGHKCGPVAPVYKRPQVVVVPVQHPAPVFIPQAVPVFHGGKNHGHGGKNHGHGGGKNHGHGGNNGRYVVKGHGY